MPEATICNRRIIFVSDKKTQTVNVCTPSGRSGVYDWIVRFRHDVPVRTELARQTPASIEEMVTWLMNSLGGRLERIPPSCDPLLTEDRRNGADAESNFGQEIMRAAERQINRLVTEFLEHPYCHRSEYNLHCELYDFLNQNLTPTFHRLGTGDRVRLIHKEWPERRWNDRLGSFDVSVLWPPTGATIGPHRSKQRGLFDVAVLSSDSVADCPEFQSYLDGRIRPTAAFEFGLNEKYDHLRADVAKLINNRLRYGCVIHFVRPGETDNFDGIEELVERASRTSYLRTAYARVERETTGVRFHYKLTNSDAVVHSATLPQVE
jgi:hypothetical protein